MINIRSEINKLDTVLVHRPGEELLYLTPDNLKELLFDDIPFLKIAQQEHDYFCQVMANEGINVLYLEDLMAQTLDISKDIRDQFIKQFIKEGKLHPKYENDVYQYLQSFSNKDLVLKTMAGINSKEIYKDQKTLLKPMPSLYYTRDSFACIDDGISLNRMHYVTRNRETIYGEYIFKYHPEYQNTPLYYDRYDTDSIEGGDITILSEDSLAVGISQRTCLPAIRKLAKKVFAKGQIKTIYAVRIPKQRACMHLDTVFTQIDINKFTYYRPIIKTLKIIKITKDEEKELDITLEEMLKEALNIDEVIMIPCGGDDIIAAKREQWNDGSNTLCIAPGKIIVYDRNVVTNELLSKYDIKLIEIKSSELSRGRGGPRCMSMPFIRK